MYRLQRIPVAPGYLRVTADHYECGECDEDRCIRILLPEDTSLHACLDGMVMDKYPADHVTRLDARTHLFAHPDVVPHMSVSADTDVAAAYHAWQAAPSAGVGRVARLRCERRVPRVHAVPRPAHSTRPARAAVALCDGAPPAPSLRPRGLTPRGCRAHPPRQRPTRRSRSGTLPTTARRGRRCARAANASWC